MHTAFHGSYMKTRKLANRGWYSCALGVGFLYAALLLLAPAARAAGPYITEIKVTGNRQVSSD
jgi:hypothetical protein